MSPLLHLLIQLRSADGLFIPERQLRIDLRVAVSPPLTGQQINEAFARADAQALAISTRDEITGEIKWRITEAGRSQLAERQI